MHVASFAATTADASWTRRRNEGGEYPKPRTSDGGKVMRRSEIASTVTVAYWVSAWTRGSNSARNFKNSQTCHVSPDESLGPMGSKRQVASTLCAGRGGGGGTPGNGSLLGASSCASCQSC
eukprot:3249950-Alexandrium_andersonii.AAC.1